MAETIQVRAVLTRFGCARVPTLDYLTTQVGINSVDSLAMLDKALLKDVKKQLQDGIDTALPVDDRVDCNVMTMVAIDMAAKAVQDLAHRGVAQDVALLNLINAQAVRYYKDVARHLASTKTSKDETEVTIPKLAGNTMANSTQFKDWMRTVLTDLKLITSVDGVTPLSYVLREADAHVAFADLDPNDSFADRCQQVAG